MKNVLIAGVVLALIGGSVLAQGPGGGRPGFGGSMPGGQGGPGMRGGMGGGMMGGGGMGGGQRRNPMARMLEELGLTADQKKKADKVLETSAAKRKKLDDETKVAIEKILTPAQKKKMADVQKEMRARFQGMMGGGGGMMGGGMGRPGGAPQGGKKP